MSTLLQDLGFALRMLSRNRGFTITAVAALALGIGANSAIFSVIYSVLLKPLPYRNPDRLLRVYQYNPVERLDRFPLAPADFRDYRSQAGLFENVATYVRQDQQYGGDHPERLTGVRVSYNFFDTLGVHPIMGRAFTREEESTCCATDVVIISYNVWQRLMGGDPHAIGKTFRLTDYPFRVIGIMPPGFEHVSGGYRLPHGEQVDVWLVYNLLSQQRVSRASHQCNTLGRLKPGVTIEQAQAEMNAIAARLESQYPDDRNWHTQLKPLQDDLVGSSRPTLLLLAGAVGFVLLIACVNVANLLLARAAAREREIAIRAAVGASRARLVRQMLTESVVLAAIGGAIGIVLSYWGVRALVGLAPEFVPRLHHISLDIRVVLATALASILAGLLFGLAPALAASTTHLRSNRPRGIFVVAELALTFVLLIGAGLLLRSFLALGRVAPGFDPRGVVTMSTSLSYGKLTGARKYSAFFEDFIEKLEALPGVSVAGATTNLPWTGAHDTALFGIDGRPRPASSSMNAQYQYISPDYLRAIGVPLLAGRWLTPADHFDAPKVVLINRTLALQYWPAIDAALGQRIYTMRDANTPDVMMTIVGVTGDVKDGPTAFAAPPVFYPPMRQNPAFQIYIALRTPAADVSRVMSAVQHVAREVGNDLSVQDIRSMEQVVAESVAAERFALEGIGVFAAIALALALIGIYGVMSYAARRRTREIAIRMALGAQPSDTLRLMMSHGARLIVAGIAIGASAAIALSRVLTGLLYQVSPTDPATFTLVGIALAAAALAACFIPARRLLATDPVESLRHE
jgi:putative ABC transport system permease protein